MTNEKEPVIVYYCQCGKSIMCASHPSLFEGNTPSARAQRKEFKQAKQWGRKVETITLAEFKKLPFICNGVPDCPITKYENE